MIKRVLHTIDEAVKTIAPDDVGTRELTLCSRHSLIQIEQTALNRPFRPITL